MEADKERGPQLTAVSVCVGEQMAVASPWRLAACPRARAVCGLPVRRQRSRPSVVRPAPAAQEQDK